MRIVIFGTGLFYENRKKIFQGLEIVAFLDNNKDLHGKNYDGVKVYNPEEVLEIECDYIVVMSNQYEVAMIKQLLSMGVDDKKIVSYSYFEQIISEKNAVSSMTTYYRKNFVDNNSNGKKVLLVSHELTLTGAPMVLFYAAEVLQKNGYHVVMTAPFDGPLKEKCIKFGITVCVDNTINQSNQHFRAWAGQFDVVVVNTLVLGKVIDNLDGINTKVLWWLHESNTIYEKEFNRLKPRHIGDNIEIYCVGALAKRCFEQYFKGIDCNNLLYGLPDDNNGKISDWTYNGEKIVFAVIGAVQKRKGQDIFVEAVKRLPSSEKEKAEFRIIGNTRLDKDYSTKVKNNACTEASIVMIEEMSHEALLKEYRDIDVVVCPSTDDPMPVTATEAMSFYRTCMVSEGTGTADLISDGESGFVFETNSTELANKISTVINNFEILKKTSINSRKLYEQYFHTTVFEKNFLQIVGNMCKNI